MAGLWQLGVSMSPSSLYAATVQPPAQTGMKAQSLHSSHAASASKSRAPRATAPAPAGRRCGRSTAWPRRRSRGRRRASRPGRWCARGCVDFARAHVHAVDGREAALLRFLAQERHLVVDEVAAVAAARRLTAAPADVMHAPPSGLSLPRRPRQRNALAAGRGRRRLSSSRMTGLNATFDSCVGEVLRREEVEQRRIGVGRLHRRSCRRSAIRVRSATCADVGDDLVEGALAAAQRPHLVVRVAVAVERDLDAVQPERVEPLDHLRRQQQPVGDDVDQHA